MAIRKRGSGWQADFTVAGVRHREQFDTEEAASTWEFTAKQAIKAGRPIPPANTGNVSGHKIQTLGQLLGHVTRSHWRGLKSGETLARSAEAAVKVIGHNTPVSSITKMDLDEVVVAFQSAGASNATINRKLAGISKLLTEAEALGMIAKKPPIPLRKEGQGRLRFLTVEEEDRMLSLCLRMGMTDLHDFLTYAIDTGCRLSEILNVRWQDISPDYERVTVWMTKNDQPRTIPLAHRTRGILRARAGRRDGPGPFCHLRKDGQLRTHFDRVRNHLGWDDVVIHTMRHTCASRFVQAGVDLLRVQKWMGHKRIETTLRYAHLMPSDLDPMLAVVDRKEAA